jgi:transketolase
MSTVGGGPVEVVTGVDEVPLRSQRVVFGETLAALTVERPEILVLDGDLANSTRADIVAERAPEQFLEMGIAEQNLIGVAAGLATMGCIPYISTFACFAVARALDQLRVTVAQPHLGVKIAAGYSGILTGSTGKTHQMVDDLAIMRAMPGMTVLAPADDIEAEALLRAAADLAGPVYVRLARDPERRVFRPGAPPPVGPVAVLRESREVALVSTGTQSARTLTAAELLASDGIEVGVVHVASLKPFDGAGLLAALGSARAVMTVEEHTVVGGLGGAVAELLAEAGGPRLRRIGLPDVYGESGSNEALLDHYGLSATRVAEQVRAAIVGAHRPPSSAMQPATPKEPTSHA